MLFDIEHVTNVFYVDKWITVTQDGGADWTELVRKVAEQIRPALRGDGGDLHVVSLDGNQLSVHLLGRVRHLSKLDIRHAPRHRESAEVD